MAAVTVSMLLMTVIAPLIIPISPGVGRGGETMSASSGIPPASGPYRAFPGFISALPEISR